MIKLKYFFKNSRVIFAGILILAFLLRLFNLGQSFWLDEAAQVIESSRPLINQLEIGADFHPPLYHILLHFWLYGGTSEIWIRFLSVMIGVGVVFMTYKVSSVLFSRNISLISASLAAISPYLIWYSQEARPYILFVFLSLVSTHFLLVKKWKLYAITSLLTLYSLYFAPFLLLTHVAYIYFFEKKLFNKILIAQFFSYSFFVPWLPFFKRQLEVGTQGIFQGWQNVVSFTPFKAIPLTFAKFIFGHGSVENNLLYGLIIVPITLIFLFSILKLAAKREGKIISLFFSLPLLISIIVTVFVPILAPQRLLFLLPYFIIIYVAGSFRLSNLPRVLFLILFCGISIAGVIQYFNNPYTQREQWRQAVSFMEETNGAKESIALFVFPEPFAPVQWYSTKKVETLGIAPDFILKKSNLDKLASNLSQKERIYFFQYLTGLTDPQSLTIQYILKLEFQETEVKDFPGVGLVYVYDKK